MATSEQIKKAVDSNTTELTTVQGFQVILKKQLKEQFKAIESIVPKHVTPERLCRVALNAVSRNPKLMDCDATTIVNSIVQCASVGLEPNLIGHAYIVPFYNNKTKKFEAQMQLGYKGVLDLIRRTGQVSTISAHEVYEGDTFNYAYGLDEKLVHIPCGETDKDKITHFYACYKLKDGGAGFTVMSTKQIDEHRDRFTKSKYNGKITGPWEEHYVQMALKTVMLKLMKFMPIGIEKQEDKQILEFLKQDNAVFKTKTNENLGELSSNFIKAEYINDDKQEKSDKDA